MIDPPPKGGQYGVQLMHLAIALVVQAKLPFAAAAKALALFAQHWCPHRPMPCANTITLWVLRSSYGQLHRPLPTGDWAWFGDVTMTIGSSKVLVVAGLPLAHIPFGVRALAPTDLYLVALAVLERSTHATIKPHLQQAMARTGVPRVIRSDEGSDIGKAVRHLIETQPTVSHLLDVAHIGAKVLKARWTADPRWAEFLRQLTHTNQRLRQTELAYLLSPRLRDKGRFMSVRVLLRFSRRVLYWLESGLADEGVRDKYGWLIDFRADLSGWTEEQQLVQQTIEEIRHQGWDEDTLLMLEPLWQTGSQSPASLRTALREYARTMIAQVRPGETLPGRTEVLESVSGHWKRMVEAGSGVGLSGLVLATAARMNPLSDDEAQTVFDRTPLQKVWTWVKTHVGTTARKLRSVFQHQTQPALT